MVVAPEFRGPKIPTVFNRIGHKQSSAYDVMSRYLGKIIHLHGGSGDLLRVPTMSHHAAT